MKRSLPFIATAALFASTLVANSTGAATVLINETFESYALNTTPTSPGDGNTNPWTTRGTISGLVESGSSPGGATPNEKVLHLQAASGQTEQLAFARTFDRVVGSAETTDSLTLSLKLNIDSLTDSAYRITLSDSTLTTNNLPINIVINSSGNVLISTRQGNNINGTIITASNPGGSGVVAGQWYEFTIDVNLQTQMFKLSITNLATSVTNSADYVFLRNVRSLDHFEIVSNTSNGTTTRLGWQVDDINVTTTIPEAGTTASLVLGGLAIGACLRISHKRRTLHMRD